MSTAEAQPDDYNPYRDIVENDGDARFPGRSAAWRRILDLLADGRYHTVDECAVAADGVWRSTVKGLLTWGARLGKLNVTRVPASVEVAPDLFLIRNVRAFRLAEAGTRER